MAHAFNHALYLHAENNFALENAGNYNDMHRPNNEMRVYNLGEPLSKRQASVVVRPAHEATRHDHRFPSAAKFMLVNQARGVTRNVFSIQNFTNTHKLYVRECNMIR